MGKRRASPIMNQGFFTALPLEVVIDILARLPVRTILNCKCVCKSWLSLINSDEFSKFHLSRSVPSLGIYYMTPQRRESPYIRHTKLHADSAYSLVEIEEGLDLELCFNGVARFNVPDHERLSIRASANGLLFILDNTSLEHEFFHICNPITREYVQLPYPQPASSNEYDITYGFGVSRISGQVKVVRIFKEPLDNHEFECRCEVHTFGTGSWRRIAFAAALKYDGNNKCGSVLNGNLHWLVQDLNGSSWISCFDLEAELFSIIPTPNHSCQTSLAVMGNHLCLCDNTGNNIVIWLMKEYGVEKSWMKEFVISDCCIYGQSGGTPIPVYPILILNDGVLLRTDYKSFLLQYSEESGITMVRYPKMNGITPFSAFRILFLHTPSFLSLKSLGLENVRSL